MSSPPDLLLITWNRLEYAEKTITNLLEDPADFRLYCWDNASVDGTADLISSLEDTRICEKHFHKANVKQQEPCRWFFNRAKSDLVGKIDDDILLPHGWIERIAPMLRAESQYGMLGCWNFMESDWDDWLAELNTVQTKCGPVFRMTTLGGCSFLMRKELALKYLIPAKDMLGHSIPIDRPKMALDGWISGIPRPPLFAHHMDDPRSEFCVKEDEKGRISALTGRSLGFQAVDDYAAWIAEDARQRLTLPFSKQLWELRIKYAKNIFWKIRQNIKQKIGVGKK